ncbi:TPA: hypothetical protein PNA82_002663 [Listeria monocytogenes]|nr:hypothetical protein [Listeria monocytogenes]HDI3668356.1 hypothetical protein [Listeria monocytogenes]
MTNYYSIEKGTKAYEYLDKTYNQDTNAFLNEVTELLGFEARGHIAVNRTPLIITKKEAQQHIENNRRHYNSTVHTYAMTAWRSRVVENLWDILRTADFSMLKEEK